VADSRHASAISDMSVSDSRNTDVLLVSGNRTYASAARLALGALGYRVTTVADGASALAAARDARFALLLVDERLPEGEGPQLPGKLRAQLPDVHIVVLVAETSTAAISDALRAGAHAAYPKPPAGPGLAAIVRRELPEGTPLLDDALVAELRAAITNPDARDALLTRFETEVHSLWSAAHEALASGQVEVLAACLHRLRGATAGMGALAFERRLAALAIRADQPLPDGARWKACHALLEQSIAALHKVLA